MHTQAQPFIIVGTTSMTRPSSKATKPRQYVFPSVSRAAIPGIRREIHSLRVREKNSARENVERARRTTRIVQASRAAAVARVMSDEMELEKLERKLEALAEQKRRLFDELKRSLDAPPPTPLPKPFHEVRRNLKAGTPLTPPTAPESENSNNSKDVHGTPK